MTAATPDPPLPDVAALATAVDALSAALPKPRARGDRRRPAGPAPRGLAARLAALGRVLAQLAPVVARLAAPGPAPRLTAKALNRVRSLRRALAAVRDAARTPPRLRATLARGVARTLGAGARAAGHVGAAARAREAAEVRALLTQRRWQPFARGLEARTWRAAIEGLAAALDAAVKARRSGAAS